jgi:hypothetical protein
MQVIVNTKGYWLDNEYISDFGNPYIDDTGSVYRTQQSIQVYEPSFSYIATAEEPGLDADKKKGVDSFITAVPVKATDDDARPVKYILPELWNDFLLLDYVSDALNEMYHLNSRNQNGMVPRMREGEPYIQHRIDRLYISYYLEDRVKSYQLNPQLDTETFSPYGETMDVHELIKFFEQNEARHEWEDREKFMSKAKELLK